MVKNHGMERNSHACTSMSTSVKYARCINSTLYRNMIGSLLYITTSRLIIAFSVSVCAKFQESHLTIVKRILKYLSVTIQYGV
jgi:hypothetical protein